MTDNIIGRPGEPDRITLRKYRDAVERCAEAEARLRKTLDAGSTIGVSLLTRLVRDYRAEIGRYEAMGCSEAMLRQAEA